MTAGVKTGKAQNEHMFLAKLSNWSQRGDSLWLLTALFAAHALCLLGDITMHCERCYAESGVAPSARARPLPQLPGMRPVTPHSHPGLGRLRRRTGQLEHARENLATAMRMYREMDMSFWLEQGRLM